VNVIKIYEIEIASLYATLDQFSLITLCFPLCAIVLKLRKCELQGYTRR